MRPVRYVLIVALTCAGVAACTSADGKPSPTRSFSTASLPSYSVQTEPSSPPTTSPSVATTGPNVQPGEKPPTLLAAGKENTSLGALAFTRFWVATIDWAYATMDSSLARRQFAPSCTGCERFFDNIIDSAMSKHETFDGGRLLLDESHLRPTDHHAGATQIVDTKVEQSALRTLDPRGEIVDSAKASTSPFRAWLRWTNSHWVVVDWKYEVVK